MSVPQADGSQSRADAHLQYYLIRELLLVQLGPRGLGSSPQISM